MKTNKFGEVILDERDLCDLIMQGRAVTELSHIKVDHAVDIQHLITLLEDPAMVVTWTFPTNSDISVPDYDALSQQRWHMPPDYHELDIAKFVLDACQSQAELQRCGEELLLFQEKGLFGLLRYLKYLVDVMHENHVIWGVGRGSSVASYVLYKIGVHRIDSLYYELDPREFLR